MPSEGKRAPKTPPLPPDSEGLRRQLIATIDSVLAGECTRKSAAVWAREQLWAFTFPVDLTIHHAALNALSFVDYERMPLEIFVDRLRSIQDALEGRSDYVVHYRHYSEEQVEELLRRPGGAKGVIHLDSEQP
jgi:hypothetical protein